MQARLSIGSEDQRLPVSHCFHLISHNLNHLSAYHVTSSRMSLGLRVYSSPLFFDPVSLLMAYQHGHFPVISFTIRYIKVRIDLIKTDNILSYLFSCCGSIATIPVS